MQEPFVYFFFRAIGFSGSRKAMLGLDGACVHGFDSRAAKLLDAMIASFPQRRRYRAMPRAAISRRLAELATLRRYTYRWLRRAAPYDFIAAMDADSVERAGPNAVA